VMGDNHIPIGQVLSFPNLTAVQQFFGPTSYISMLAGIYFLADINATKRPGALLMTCYYNNQWLPAWTMSAQLPTMTLATLQSVQANSRIAITIGGQQYISGPISLATVTSFSDAAMRIGAAIHNTGSNFHSPATGVAVGSMMVTCSGTTMTVISNTAPGAPGATGRVPINAGDLIFGSGWPLNTYVVSRINSPDGLTGTFQLNQAHTQATNQLVQMYRNPCTWDAQTYQFKISAASANQKSPQSSSISYVTAVSGTLANQLGLTQAAGATIQPQGNTYLAGAGPLISTAAAFMDGVTKVTMNWASFATAFDPDAPGSNVQKQAFAAWTNAQQNNYMYCAWDTDPAPTLSPNAPSSLARILNTSLTSGTAPISSPSAANGRNLAVFTMGVVAAIDFNRFNGRKTLAFRAQTGITPDISNGGIAANLEANKYNYYGIWTTSNDLFRFLYPGVVSGPYRWIDSYINQIWMNNGFQLALMNLLTSVGSIPYNQAGYTLIKAALQDVINRAVFFGAIRTGITLSQAQIAEVNNMAGVPIDGILRTQGYYLQILDADPQVRANRGTPPCTFWYMDGGSVQRITLASVMVQ
jgi:Protein of unknown function (DUF3383)